MPKDRFSRCRKNKANVSSTKFWKRFKS